MIIGHFFVLSLHNARQSKLLTDMFGHYADQLSSCNVKSIEHYVYQLSCLFTGDIA